MFRRVVRDAGPPDLFFTEFTSTDGLCTAGRPRVIGRLRFTPDERPLIAQIWGNMPEHYRRVAAAREGAGDLPVSVKTRIGIARPKAEKWLGFLLAQGLSALTVHGRTVVQQSDGEADWASVSLAVRLRDEAGLATRIIGNGDVRTPAMFLRRVRETGADGIMIGRGIFENLFLFAAIRAAKTGSSVTGIEFSRLDPHSKISHFRRHLDLHRETWVVGRSFDVVKKFARTYLRAFEGAGRLVDAIMRTRTHEEAQEVLDAWRAEHAARRYP